MLIDPSQAYYITNVFVVILFSVQFLEFFYLKSTFTRRGPWPWELIQNNYKSWPKPLQKIMATLLKYPNVIALLFFRQTLVLLSLLYPFPHVYILILLSSLILLSRWRGTFNGGSDYMSTILLTGLTIGAITKNTEWAASGLFYIAIHSLYSYFKAGIVKVIRPEWRNGQVLKLLLSTSPYNNPMGPFIFLLNKKAALAICWAVLIFELCFPFSLLSPPIMFLFLLFGLIFHAMIVFMFGLNRFLWAWLATYPSLIFTSLIVNSLVF